MKNYFIKKIFNTSFYLKNKVIDPKSYNLHIEQLIRIIRTKRKKTVNISLKYNEILITAPYFLEDKYILNLLRKKQKWIKKKVLENNKNKINDIFVLKEGSIILFLGKNFKVKINKGIEDNIAIIKDKVEITYKRKNTNLKKNLEKWYKDKCFFFLKKRLCFLSKKIGVNYKGFSIKSYKKRLGCCSNDRHLFFNWKLIMLPREILDYIIIHELCHIIHFNHSKLFWQKVHSFCPDFKSHKKWLKDNNFIFT